MGVGGGGIGLEVQGGCDRRISGGSGGLGRRGSDWSGGHGGCERRIEVFVKIQKKIGGGSGGGVWVGGGDSGLGGSGWM